MTKSAVEKSEVSAERPEARPPHAANKELVRDVADVVRHGERRRLHKQGRGVRVGEGVEGGSFCLVRAKQHLREGSEKVQGPTFWKVPGRFWAGHGVGAHRERARAARLLEARSLSARPGLSTPTSLMSSAGLPEHSRDGMNGQQPASRRSRGGC